MVRKENKYVVYLHLKKGTKEVFYVGMGSKRRPYCLNKRGVVWNNYYNKYGRDVVIINEGLSYEDALYVEEELIKCFGRVGIEEGGVLSNRVIKVGTHFKGRRHSSNTKLVMSESAKNRKSHNKPCFWRGVTYKSVRECSREEEVPYSTVQKYLMWDKIKDCYYLSH